MDLDITRFYKGLISLDVRDIFPSLSPASAKAINRNALRVACMSVSSLITRQRIECFRAAPADTKQGARYHCTQTIVGEDEDARCSCEAYHRVDLMYGKEKHTVTRSEKAVGVVSHAVPSGTSWILQCLRRNPLRPRILRKPCRHLRASLLVQPTQS